jgi:hypothetical protein
MIERKEIASTEERINTKNKTATPTQQKGRSRRLGAESWEFKRKIRRNVILLAL